MLDLDMKIDENLFLYVTKWNINIVVHVTTVTPVLVIKCPVCDGQLNVKISQ